MFSPSLELILTVAHREAGARRHTHLTLEHLLYALAHDPEGERILAAVGVDLRQLRADLDNYLRQSVEQYGRGRQREPEQTLAFRRVLQTAVLHVQSAGRDEVRAGDVLAALMQEPRTYAAQLLASQGVTRLDILNYISHGITKVPVHDDGGAGEPGSMPPHGEEEPERHSGTARNPLQAYAINLTERAAAGKLDPLIGRTRELQRTIQILCRRRKNNPVFVGEPGVGKTALAEGLALRLLQPDAPAPLRGAEIFSLDTTALLAGTRFRGDFEERFKAVIAALSKRRKPILFIDEIHTTIGAGATTGGTLDLAALIKPVLVTGELRIIGSTTFEEFKHIEKDRALARRLQKVTVEEPSVQETVQILKGLQRHYETHHHVHYSPEAIEAAARLAARHLRDLRLPDSAIDLLDEAGAMMRLEPQAPADGNAPDAAPPVGGSDDERRWPAIETTHIERIVARMANIPDRQASASDRQRLKTLEESLSRVVFGQEEAVSLVAAAIKRSSAGLAQPDRPAGCFLFTGPTGVGKTELAKQLALHLGNEFIRYDMSEYMEKHAVARLVGAPPGYVGFEQGGLLVDAIRAHPYAVLLMDEIEKAHPDVLNILLQVMDHATLTDNNGRRADFRHVILIMTSNAGSRELSSKTIGFAEAAGDQKRVDETREKAALARSKAAIDRLFSPEFRNRLDAIVTFKPLTPAVMETIVGKFILQLEAQLAERRVAITLEPEARTWLARRGFDPVYGARPLARVIQTEVRDRLADELLFGRLENGG
ncbi:MAG TPA: AAA family ATPase, partial [Vicinamibacterales bacterium]|nr:AAA family ATPase [Vicinamibacterales bacterium]